MPTKPAAFEVEEWPIDRPVPYPGNPRINEHAVEKVAVSLREFGWQQPIVVDRKGVVIVGHTRLLAAQSLGWRTVPVKTARNLTPGQVAAYRLADNRTGEEALWDEEKLILELRALDEQGVDLSLTAFDGDELAQFLEVPKASAAEIDRQEVPPAPAHPTTKKGDRILLGPHVVVCGDARDGAAFDRLLGTERVDAVWTDPPYAVAYVGKTKAKLTIKNDEADVPALTQLLRSALGRAKARVKQGGAWFVAGPHGPPFLAFALVLTELGVWRQTLVWIKDRFVLSRQDFHWQQEVILAGVNPPDADPDNPAGEALHEFTPIAYGWNPDGPHTWLGDRRQCTVIECDRPAASREHPTMKPVELVERLLELTVPRGGLVLDCFAGSGSTLLACETSGRVARCLELDPGYCDVIVARWEDATGQVAVRE